MIEVVFGDSACGSLKEAKSQGSEKTQEAPARFFTLQEGKDFSPHGLRGIQNLGEKRLGQALMEGSAQDVYGFHLVLSVGAIDSGLVGTERENVLAHLYSIYPGGGRDVAASIITRSRKQLQELCYRVGNGEDVRIWYSNHPDEQCGLCWIVSELGALPNRGHIFLIKLPPWERGKSEGVLVEKSNWGETEPEEWASYLSRQIEAPPAFCMALSQKWRMLQKKNAPLRAVVNGRLLGVANSFYDDFIKSEIVRQPQEFCQAVVIGKILGKYQLGISDAWIALRMEEMLQTGELKEVTRPKPNDPRYFRTLRRSDDIAIDQFL